MLVYNDLLKLLVRKPEVVLVYSLNNISNLYLKIKYGVKFYKKV